MALQTPLIFDELLGVPRRLDSTDTLAASLLQLTGGLGLYGTTPPAARPALSGDWDNALEEALNALIAFGLVEDQRGPNWRLPLDGLLALGRVGPFEAGRLIIGSQSGWTQLDQPALVPGAIQVPVAHAGPPEVTPGGQAVTPLAYSQVLSYGPTPPVGPVLTGALWYNTVSGDLEVWSGNAWINTTDSAITGFAQVNRAGGPNWREGRIPVTGRNQGQWAFTPDPQVGTSLVYLGNGVYDWQEPLLIRTVQPWPDGSAGQQDQAIWLDPTPNRSTLNLWDPATRRWLSVPLADPTLNGLAALRGQWRDGDLFTWTAGRADRLAAGVEADALRIINGLPQWHAITSLGARPPLAPLEGDIWRDGDGNLHLRANGRWEPLSNTHCSGIATAPPGAGTGLRVGMAVVRQGNAWIPASGVATAQPLPIGIVVALDAQTGLAEAAVSALVVLPEADWPQGALVEGAWYRVSPATPGVLEICGGPDDGVVVGQALSSTHLLLAGAAVDPGARTLVADPAGGAVPTALRDGQAWWNPATQVLQIWDQASGQWVAINGATGAGGTAGHLPGQPGAGQPGQPPAVPGLQITAIEAIDWVADARTAGLRFQFADGTDQTIRFRGAGGATVTMADAETLVVDALVGTGGGGGGGAGGGVVINGGIFTP